MPVRPLRSGALCRPSHRPPAESRFAPAAPAPGAGRTVRLKEITAVYREVTLACPLGATLAAAPAIHSPEEVYRLFSFLAYEAKEHFLALHLSAKNEILCLDQVSVGSLTAAIVHPREVFKSALLSSAAAIVVLHNHPSGDPTPSREDLALHARLTQAGELLGISVLDGLIIGSQGRYRSLATAGFHAEDLSAPD
jgi:DNA repair protein RadC